MPFVFEILLPAVVTGTILYLIANKIAELFASTGSTNLIRGLDNPWTYRTLAFVVAIGYPIYSLILVPIS